MQDDYDEMREQWYGNASDDAPDPDLARDEQIQAKHDEVADCYNAYQHARMMLGLRTADDWWPELKAPARITQKVRVIDFEAFRK